MEQKTYTLDEIKAAYWKEFHKSGEIFFDYLGPDEENDQCTEENWDSFVWCLENADRK